MNKQISAVDLFCGVGGLAYGLYKAGIKINAGIDIDESAKYAFETNCNANFLSESIADILPDKIVDLYPKDDIKILVGCAPCQPFSKYTLKVDKSKDKKWRLLESFSKIINTVQPDIVSMENVPQLLKFKQAPIFQTFITNLEKQGYFTWYDIIYAPDYGIPQKRKRLVLLASKYGNISLLPPTHTSDNYVTVRHTIEKLEKIASGETSKKDFFHKAAKLSPLNLKRIQQSKPGGSWKKDWDKDLILACHKDKKGKSYGSIYGRMKWDEPAPTMTTFCTGIGNGRFGHPEQDRAISLREAALIQSFPIEYQFVKNKESLVTRNAARHIGNAVPPKLGEIIGKSIINHLNKYHD